MSITELSVKRPTLVVVVFTILTLLGIISYSSLNYELLPKISSPVLSVTTIYPGAAPAEVENAVTIKVEEAVSSIEGVKSLKSISMEGVSQVTVELNYGTDVDEALQDAQRKTTNLIPDLPDQVTQPTVDKFSLDELPIMQIGASSNLDPIEFSQFMNDNVKEEISRIEGVARVQMIGEAEREIRVNVDREKLKAYNLSILQVTQAISAANLDFPTGRIKDDAQQILVRLSGKFQSIKDMEEVAITSNPDGGVIKIKDVAEIVDARKEVETISRVNGKESIGLLISKQSDGNTVQVAEDVKEKMHQLETNYEDLDLKFILAQDSSEFTLEAANAVIEDLLLAVILVSIIMLFFLHSIRDALIVMVSIPISIVTTFIIMNLMGFSLNLMTLMGLSLVVGILVDDSIVVIENIHARMSKGESAYEAAKSTWRQIGLSVLSITLTIIVVFLPITFVTGIIADLLRQFALVVAFATAISFLVSFTVTPLLSSRFSKAIKLDHKKLFHKPLIAFENFLKSLNDLYKSFLIWTLAHKRLTVAIIGGLIIGSFTLVGAGFIGSEFVKEGDNGQFIVNIELPKESTVEETNAITREVENRLLNDPLVKSVFTSVGTTSAAASGQSTAYIAEVNVNMVSLEERTTSSADYAQTIRKDLSEKIVGAKFKVSPVGMVGGGTAAPIQVIVKGNNINELIKFGEKALKVMDTIPGTLGQELSVQVGNPEVAVSIDREKMATLGLNMQMVGGTMQNAFAGNTDNKYRTGQKEYDINIKLDKFNRRDIEDIKRLTFLNNYGELIALEQFATIGYSEGPSRLERDDKQSSIIIMSQVLGRPQGTVGQEVQAAIAQMDVPVGIEVDMGGDLESMNDAFIDLGIALLMSIILVYLIMVALYESYIYPFVVMLSVPVALIGAFLALALAMENLSIFTILGVIMLVGLVIKNAILIVDFANQLKKEGKSSYDAVVEAGLARFRPILMTTIAMVIAMMPVAFAAGAGASWKNGLAFVLIGGLLSSMILTVVLIPIMFVVVDIWSSPKRNKKLKSTKNLENSKTNDNEPIRLATQ